jgi:hypothetical protein
VETDAVDLGSARIGRRRDSLTGDDRVRDAPVAPLVEDSLGAPAVERVHPGADLPPAELLEPALSLIAF